MIQSSPRATPQTTQTTGEKSSKNGTRSTLLAKELSVNNNSLNANVDQLLIGTINSLFKFFSFKFISIIKCLGVSVATPEVSVVVKAPYQDEVSSAIPAITIPINLFPDLPTNLQTNVELHHAEPITNIEMDLGDSTDEVKLIASVFTSILFNDNNYDDEISKSAENSWELEDNYQKKIFPEESAPTKINIDIGSSEELITPVLTNTSFDDNHSIDEISNSAELEGIK